MQGGGVEDLGFQIEHYKDLRGFPVPEKGETHVKTHVVWDLAEIHSPFAEQALDFFRRLPKV